ncbi:MAG TPA: ATP-binding protein [Acidimicrobiales bacterium]
MAYEDGDHARAALLHDLLRSRSLLFSEFEHKLKTSFSVIAGWAETLTSQWDTLGEKERQLGVESLARKAAEVVEQANALLEKTQAELATLESDRAVVDLAAMARANAEVYAAVTAAHEFDYDGPEAAPVVVDAAALDQVIGLLLENAIKYSPAGTTVQLRVVRQREHVELAVVDAGLGIPTDVDIWAPFVRGAEAEREAPGTGIGLYVVRNLVRAMRGDVAAYRNPEGGSTFVVRLPPA